MTSRWIAESARSERMTELLRSARTTAESLGRASGIWRCGLKLVAAVSSLAPATCSTVSPTWTCSPPRRTASSTRSPFTHVPFAEPRSRSRTVPSSAVRTLA